MTTFLTMSARGWRRNLSLFALGICATLTLAPFYVFPLIIPAYGGLFLFVSGAPSRKRAFFDGWWWGFGFFISGLYWFSIALLTDAEKFAWAIPLALFPLNGIIALYPALACLFFYIFISPSLNSKPQTLNSACKALLFASIWMLCEYARGHLFSGFPWNLAGYAFGFSDVSLQLASILGVYGLTFFTVLLGVAAVLLRGNIFFSAVVWGLFVLSMIWGGLRLGNAEDGQESGAVLRLVQGNILQHHKWDPALQQKNLEEYIALTRSEGIEKVTHVIWPETAIPYALRSNTPLAYHLGAMLPAGVKLIAGTLRMEVRSGDFKVYNSAVMLNGAGEVIGNYDKHALVPFGEFMPLRYLLPKSLKLPVGDKDFSEGGGAQTLKWEGLPAVSPLICYEGIFPEFAVDDKKRPEWMLNITNDAWFGSSTGPYQHFAMVRMRAVEQALPLARVANTGITAYIDEYGRVNALIKLGKKGFEDILLRKSGLYGTIYNTYNIKFISLFMCIFTVLFCGLRSRFYGLTRN